MTYVIYSKTKKIKEVRNLGWLLRHHSEVIGFEMYVWETYAAWVVALLEDDRYFLARFGSYAHFQDWVCRPSFMGLRIRSVGEYPEPTTWTICRNYLIKNYTVTVS